jgi:Helix-turn-helix domain
MNITEALLIAGLRLLESRPDLAARVRAVLGVDAGGAWIPLHEAPLARKTARRLVRSGAIAGKLVANRWYLSRTSLDAYLRSTEDADLDAESDEDALRAELGLRRAS